MKERPILMNGPMVRATLDGTKTQTRRIIKPQPDLIYCGEPSIRADDYVIKGIKCPYGRVGDRLWVRESFYQWGYYSYRPKLGGGSIREFVEVNRPNRPLLYAADGDPDPAETRRCRYHRRPSIFMPRNLSRILLEITDTRVERLQDISEEDAIAEGFHNPEGLNRNYGDRARYWFRNLWESINGHGSWKRNDRLWVVEFKRVEDAK